MTSPSEAASGRTPASGETPRGRCRHRGRAAAAAAAAALGLLLASAPPAAEDASGARWSLARVAYPSGWDALPALVAIERGYLARERITASGMAVNDARTLGPSLASGSTDFAAVPQPLLLAMAAAGVPFRIVAGNGWSTRIALVVRADSEIDSLAALAGQRVAVAPGSAAVAGLVRVLDAAGFPPGHVVLQKLAAADFSRALRQGQVAAICASEHFTGPLVATGAARALISHEDVVAAVGWIGAGALVASEPVLARDPDLVQRFVRGWIAGLHYLQREPAAAAELLRVFLHRQGVDVSAESSRTWVGLTRYDRGHWAAEDLADAKYNAWGLAQAGLLERPPDLDERVESRFAQQALREIRARAASSP